MELQVRTSGLLLFASLLKPAEAVSLQDPEMCFILDVFLGVYGLIVTGLVIKETFFSARRKAADEGIYSEPKGEEAGHYAPLMPGDPAERNRRMMDDDSLYTGLTKRTDGEYKELPVQRQRQGKNEPVYQGLSSATKGVYDFLPVKPLPAH